MTPIKMLRFACIVLTVIAFTACKKSNVMEYPDFVGTWRGTSQSTDYIIDVNLDGKGEYNKIKGNATTFHEGRIIISPDEIKIGFKKLPINTFPASSDDMIWTMTVDNIAYQRD